MLSASVREERATRPVLERPPVEDWFPYGATTRRAWLREAVVELADAGDALSRLTAVGMLLRYRRRSTEQPHPMESAIRPWLAAVGPGRLGEIEEIYVADAISDLRATRDRLDRYDRRDPERKGPDRDNDLEVVVRGMLRDRDDLQSACVALLLAGAGSATESALSKLDAQARIDELLVSLVETEAGSALLDRLDVLWRRESTAWWVSTPLR